VSHDAVETVIRGSIEDTYAWNVRDAFLEIRVGGAVVTSADEWGEQVGEIEIDMDPEQRRALAEAEEPSGTDPATAWREQPGQRYADLFSYYVGRW
jgi:2',3'-cyclic-nucleotide 2'-phosphodiesterase (5'-nucleotidase family)